MSVPSDLLKNISELELARINLMKSVAMMDKQILSLRKKLFETCKHQWIRDVYAAFDDHCKEVCSICHSYNNKYYYE